jgi:hypothetical protein
VLCVIIPPPYFFFAIQFLQPYYTTTTNETQGQSSPPNNLKIRIGEGVMGIPELGEGTPLHTSKDTKGGQMIDIVNQEVVELG